MSKRKGSKYEQKHRDQRRGKFRPTSPFSEPEKSPLFQLEPKGRSLEASRVWGDLPISLKKRRFRDYDQAVKALENAKVEHEPISNSKEVKEYSFKYVRIVQVQ